jgi:hypothetical protein
LKIEPLERIVDPIGDPIGTAQIINRNTARIERAFLNAVFRDEIRDNYMKTDFNMDRRKIVAGTVRVHEYE